MRTFFGQGMKNPLRKSIDTNGKSPLEKIELSRIYSLAKITFYYKAIIHGTPLFKILLIVYRPIDFKNK
jgi:hypothetical protein